MHTHIPVTQLSLSKIKKFEKAKNLCKHEMFYSFLVYVVFSLLHLCETLRTEVHLRKSDDGLPDMDICGELLILAVFMLQKHRASFKGTTLCGGVTNLTHIKPGQDSHPET